MAQIEQVTYGPGGFDPQAPDSNIVAVETIDVPDGAPSNSARLAAVEDALVAAGGEVADALAADPRSPVGE